MEEAELMKRCVFIGKRFYDDSATIMSSIYSIEKDGAYKRYDWGFLQIDVENGEEVNIRPATKEELIFFENKLNETNIKWGKQKGTKSNVYSITEDTLKAISEEFGDNVYVVGP